MVVVVATDSRSEAPGREGGERGDGACVAGALLLPLVGGHTAPPSQLGGGGGGGAAVVAARCLAAPGR